MIILIHCHLNSFFRVWFWIQLNTSLPNVRSPLLWDLMASRTLSSWAVRTPGGGSPPASLSMMDHLLGLGGPFGSHSTVQKPWVVHSHIHIPTARRFHEVFPMLSIISFHSMIALSFCSVLLIFSVAPSCNVFHLFDRRSHLRLVSSWYFVSNIRTICLPVLATGWLLTQPRHPLKAQVSRHTTYSKQFKEWVSSKRPIWSLFKSVLPLVYPVSARFNPGTRTETQQSLELHLQQSHWAIIVVAWVSPSLTPGPSKLCIDFRFGPVS